MAAKSSGKRKTTGKTAAKRGRPASRQTKKVEKRSNQVTAIVYFALGVLVFFLSIIDGENVWGVCHDVLFGLFGFTGYIIAPLFIYIAICASTDRPIGAVKHKIWQTFLLLVLFSSLLQILCVGSVPGDGFIDKWVGLYEDGVALRGGGIVSGFIGWPLLAACGQTGAGIITGLLIFVFLMILTGTTLHGFLSGVATPVRKMKEDYAERVEQKELARAERSAARFDIDVDLGPTAKPLNGEPISVPDFSGKEQKPEKKKKRPSRIDIPLDDAPEKQQPAEEKKPFTVHIPGLDDDDLPVGEPAASAADVKNAAEHTAAQPSESSEPQAAASQPVNEPIAAEKMLVPDADSQLHFDTKEKPETYVFPPISLLRAPKAGANVDASAELKANAERLVDTLKSFGVQTRVINVSRGPAVTRYELQPSAGVKISRITGLADDIALNLAAAGVRIEAPIPNKPAVGIEVPNKIIDVVTMREIIDTDKFYDAKSKLTVALGRDIAGNVTLADLAKMPHLLIAGSTGSGKSVCINSIIISLLYKAKPDEVRLLMIDPKVVELGVYNGIPHLLVPVVTDPRKAAGALGWAVTEMLKRYKLFADNSVRDLEGYNSIAENSDELEKLPQIVIIIDELADLMMAAPNEVEDSICRLAQMARAAGMHLIIATQRPSVDVITGLIKANIPSRIAFAVSSQVDSRTILDGSGAEKLLGRGDMLFYPVGFPKPLRVQGCFVTEKEVEQVVGFVKHKETTEYDQKVIDEIEKQAVAEKGSGGSGGGGFDEKDDMLSAAIECVIEAGQASTSYLQRRLKLGYARAARLIDEMEEMGIVGPFEGSKPRQVLMTRQQWLERNMNRDEAQSEE